MDYPQILTLNLESDINDFLKLNKFSIYEGTIGFMTKVSPQWNSVVRCLLQGDYPNNIHEFEIAILDLTNRKIVNYQYDDHVRKINKTGNNTYFKCEYPTTIFDPRACELNLLKKELSDNWNKNFILLIFGARNEDIPYTYVSDKGEEDFSVSLYDFIPPSSIEHYNKEGKYVTVEGEKSDLHNLLKKYKQGVEYEICFEHPRIYEDSKQVPAPSFVPLAHSKDEDIVSFLNFYSENSAMFLFPKIENKKDFLLEFLQNIAPSMFPAIFPNNIKNSWVNNELYILPNQEKLNVERLQIEDEYKQKLQSKDEEIEKNITSFKYLHNLLTETGENLVAAVIKFFRWLEFDEVVDADTLATGTVKEEDIQIETDKGLLIFEVKGIGSTSKDADCSQIGKIKYRRSRQRNSFDVYANYIVNHQRHLPAKDRKNPPFTLHQIEDAINDQRGLLTTWQLFQLYFSIERDAISKEEVRECFYNYGLIDFIPKNYIQLNEPTEILRKNTVVVLTLTAAQSLTLSDSLFVVNDKGFHRLNILSLKVNDKSVSSARDCEVGILLDSQIEKRSSLYKVVI